MADPLDKLGYIYIFVYRNFQIRMLYSGDFAMEMCVNHRL